MGERLNITGVIRLKKEERKVIVKLLETERMNTYKILAEFLAIKFNENGFDKTEKK